MTRILKRLLPAAITLIVSAAAMAQQIVVTVNGTQVPFPNTQPQMVGGRVLVPLRGVFQQMGADVHWMSATQQIDAHKGGTSVQLQIGNSSATVNGQTVRLDVPPQLMANTTMVPLRFVSEALGADVNWVAAQNLVAITMQPSNVAIAPPPQRRVPPPPIPPRMQRIKVFPVGAVFPLRLDQPLGSDASPTGSSFTCTLYTYGAPWYGGLPAGTRVLGHVDFSRRRTRTEPGILRVAFDSVQLPNGALIPINGSLIGLDNGSVSRGANGILVARPSHVVRGDQAPVWVGTGGGFTVTVLPRSAFSSDITIRTAIGNWRRSRPVVETVTHDVDLSAGTELGVRLNSAFVLH